MSERMEKGIDLRGRESNNSAAVFSRRSMLFDGTCKHSGDGSIPTYVILSVFDLVRLPPTPVFCGSPPSSVEKGSVRVPARFEIYRRRVQQKNRELFSTSTRDW